MIIESDLRKKIIKLQKTFDEATSLKEPNEGTNYFKISNTINCIQDILKPFIKNKEAYDNTVFLIGPTGVGKSTLLNYIAGKNLSFKMYDDKPGIFPVDGEEIAYVGQGEGSTTVVPNIWHANTADFKNVTFIDCAGDFDSGGVITEVINSKIKSTIAQNVKNAKVLIVTSQDSISPSGSYGIIFKNGLEKSAQFLNDINYFQDSIGLIVSHAGRIFNTSKTIESYLKSVSNNPQIVKYKTVIENLLQNNQVAIFSKYSDEINENNIYTPPTWNLDQRDKIVELIKSIKYQKIPNGLFNDSSSLEVREQMSIAFEVLKTKAVDLMQTSLKQALQNKLILYSTELKIFANFVEQEVISNKLNSGLTDYIKHLNSHNFLKVFCSEDVKKLSNELEFLAPFTKAHYQSQQIKENWGSLIGIHLLFKDILHEAKIVIYEADELFSTFVEKNKIITIGCFGENSKQLKTFFTDLSKAYENKSGIEANKNDDKYYFYEAEKKFIGFKQIPYNEEVPYVVKESYIEKVPASHEVEHYSEREKVGIDKVKRIPGSIQAYGWQEAYDYHYTIYEERNVPKTRVITKYKDETKYRDVIKYKTVTKHKDEPEYKDVQVKKFNEAQYNKEINAANVIIGELKAKTNEFLHKIYNINLAKKQKLPLNISDQLIIDAKTKCLNDQAKYNEIKESFKQLSDAWKYLEYEAQVLSQYESEIIGSDVSTNL